MIQRFEGLDIGLDNKGRIWIIEANLKPNIFPFLLLKDKTMYRRIMLFNIKKL
ncbi:YheC/YheD family protein [Paenibacillus cremeus]|uniref:YheC/YheD family protein n=1 Tax=Paenibacillus cremeus TaxID=2163881 RepID=UPI0037039455